MGSSPPPPRRIDRLSDLPDDVLGHVLSFLPTKEAARAAALARRWRHAFGNVRTISIEEEARAGYSTAHEKKGRNAVLLDGVCSALLARRLSSGYHVPLHGFRVAFAENDYWNFVHVDQWLVYVLRHCRQELHLDLRFHLAPLCKHRDRDDDDDDEHVKEQVVNSDSDNTEDDEPDYKKMRRQRSYVLPRRLFRCTAIRTLCAYCRLKLPAAVNLPFLETLSITTPSYCDGPRSIQRLIDSCPRLIDLTLKAIHCLKRVSVLHKRLRRFTLRCCHNLKSVDIDASELKSLDYCGTVPVELLFSLHDTPGIPLCTVDFCLAHSKGVQFDGFRRFMEKISDTRRLHLHHGSLESRFFLRFPLFSNLTQLMLQGPVESCGTVVAVARVLEQTPNLELLYLCMEEYASDKNGYDSEEDEDYYMDNLFLAPDEVTVPDESSFSVSCLWHRVKEINMVHYKGGEAQRMMARLLFSNAIVLERMCVALVKGMAASQSKLIKNEIERWVVAYPHKVFL
uniref:Uncharacterized protein n=1 Tax=Avena sativa TaxID=4498 RepID=A0ACD5V1L9_AVESA